MALFHLANRYVMAGLVPAIQRRGVAVIAQNAPTRRLIKEQALNPELPG
ncbi:MAG: hypothetical protein WAN31_02625 [Methylovirgula sp.]